MGVSLFFHCGLSLCFHLPFGWASLSWSTESLFFRPPALSIPVSSFKIYFSVQFLFLQVAANRAFIQLTFFPLFKTLFVTADLLRLLWPKASSVKPRVLTRGQKKKKGTAEMSWMLRSFYVKIHTQRWRNISPENNFDMWCCCVRTAFSAAFRAVHIFFFNKFLS